MLVTIVGGYKTGKTISACTFPKPMLILDYDNGLLSVKTTLNKEGKRVVEDQDQIFTIPMYKDSFISLDFKSDMKTPIAPAHTAKAVDVMKKHNDTMQMLYEKGGYQYGENTIAIKTLVIDSLTVMFRVWKEAILKMNSIPSLRISDYGLMEQILFGQFFPSLRALLNDHKVEHVVLIDHTDLDKDAITGMILEYPVGPSQNMGRSLGRELDEIYKQEVQSDGTYIWRTRPTGFFVAGSRLNVPDKIAANFKSLESYLKVADGK